MVSFVCDWLAVSEINVAAVVVEGSSEVDADVKTCVVSETVSVGVIFCVVSN